MKTIVKILHGSHLYGTNTPNSDTDYKSIYLPDAKELLLTRAKSNTRKSTGVAHQKNTKDDIDEGNFSLHMYFKLLAEGQTMAFDMLFAPPSHVIESSPLWDYIQSNRHRFVHKNVSAFASYCQHQAGKYGVKGSRMSAVKKTMDLLASLDPKKRLWEVWDQLQTLEGTEHVAFYKLQSNKESETLIDYFEIVERKFDRACWVGHTLECVTKIYNNYGARAKLAMTNEGIDWKALSHAVRVCVQGLELLNTGHMTLPLPARELEVVRAIKLGMLPYNDVAHIIEDYVDTVEKTMITSSLPAEIDHEFCDEIVASSYLMHMNTGYNPYIDDEKTIMWLMELTDENLQ